jgi:hypothetical protein
MSDSEQQLELLLRDLSAEEQRVVLVRVLHDKFFSSIGSDEVSFTPSTKVVQEMQEIFMNVGSDDGVTHDQVRDVLLKTGCVKVDQIQKIRVIKRRSFIQLPGDCTKPLMNALRGISLGGRHVRINLITDEEERPMRRRPHGRRKKY